MLSRVANSVYWLGRYIERAENVARFVDVNLNLMLGAQGGAFQQWSPLVSTSGDHLAFAERYGEHGATRENVVRFLTFDAENPNSILACVRSARENARTVRDTISSEVWEQANRLYLFVNDAAASVEAEGADLLSLPDFYARLKMGCHLLQGITDATMSHNEAWRFFRVGRKLERADKTTRILDVKYFLLLPRLEDVGSSIDDIQWTAVLKSVSAFEMYRKRHGRIAPKRVAEFLLLDTEFPRSVRYCAGRALTALGAVSGSARGGVRTPPERLLGQLNAELEYKTVDEIIHGGLHEFLDEIQSKLNAIDDSIYDTYFAMRPLDKSQRQAQSQTSASAGRGW
ncbi:MAG: alpha-E domain-containing protein [Bryobacterales bacterium]|nr:alpha-E domain-containing protein [Bryobacterales bacterium]